MPKPESSLKLTAAEGWRDGKLAGGEEKEATFTVCSLFRSQCADLWMEEGMRKEERGGKEGGEEGGQLYLAGEASCAWASWRRVGDGIRNPTCCLHKTPFATKHTRPLAPTLL